jgi:pilus assembly protein CpaF
MTRPELGDPRLTASTNGAGPNLVAAQHMPGPSELPHRPAGEAAAVERLRQHLRDELSTHLSRRIRADETAGRPPMDAPARRRLAEAILTDATEAHAQAELRNSATGGMQPLLADTDIENININGDRVFVKYADGRRNLCRRSSARIPS